MFFSKNLIKKRAKIFHAAYLQSINEISEVVKGKDKKPLSVDAVVQEMVALFNLTEIHAFSGDKSPSKLKLLHNARIKSGHALHVSQRHAIDATIGYQLARYHGIGISDSDYWVEHLLTKVSHHYDDRGIEWANEIREQPHFELSLLSPLEKEFLTEGVIYAGSANDMYREAIALNANELQHGSVWTVDSVEANKIKAALVGRGVDSEDIFIHTEESLAERKVFIADGNTEPLQAPLHIVVENYLSGLTEELEDAYGYAIRAFFAYNRKCSLNGANSLPSPDSLTLPRLIELRDNAPEEGESDFSYYWRYAKDAVALLSSYFGGEIGNHAEATGEAMEHFNATMYQVREYCKLYQKIFVTEGAGDDVSLIMDELIEADGKHHIFVGKRLGSIFVACIHDRLALTRMGWQDDPRLKLNSYKARFHEQTDLIHCAMFVLPATGGRLPAPMNVFFHRSALMSKWGREELASANHNTRVAVIGKPFGVDTITNIFLEYLKIGRYVDTTASHDKGLFFSRHDFRFMRKIVMV